jgi:AcrR family transcriptional regulator
MPRNKKDHPPTKARIIAAAWQLFSSQGYDRATVEAILENVGVSKGAFYHYFSSKEDVLDAVVEHLTGQALDHIKSSLQDASLSAIGKLNRFLSAARNWRLANIGLLKGILPVLLRDKNVIIRHKISLRNVALALPVLADIIAQGVREGVFDTVETEETARLILHLAGEWGEVQTKALLEAPGAPENLALFQRRINLFTIALERILAAPKGSLETVDRETLSRAIESWGS